MKNIVSIVYLLFLILLILISCDKSSSDWVKYNTDDEGDIYSYKKGIILRNEDDYIAQVWGKQVFSDKGKEKYIQDMKNHGLSTKGYDKLSYYQILYEIDCNKKRSRALSIIMYDTHGNGLYSIKNKNEWNHIIPNSNGEFFLKKVCK